MNSARKTFEPIFQLFAGLDLTFLAIVLHVIGDGDCNVELMGVWVWLLGFLQLLDMPRAQFEVLLQLYSS